jgi:hypothetical protein
LTFTNGLPARNSPVARSSTYMKPLRFAHRMTLRGRIPPSYQQRTAIYGSRKLSSVMRMI